MRILGLMSGTSLDGIDIAVCDFSFDGKYHYKVISTESISYSTSWRKRLMNAHLLDAYELIKLSKEYGRYLGTVAIQHAKKQKLIIDFIASHGHTIFHKPNEGVNFQLGDGNEIAVSSQIPTIYDFRSADIAYHGQGAPLVPIGDLLLFPDYACLNLGGFSNVSYNHGPHRIAYDICPVNIILNHLSRKYYQVEFDDKGKFANKGKVIPSLLQDLNSLSFYSQPFPKSLGREWFEVEFLPLINNEDDRKNDVFATVYEHITDQLANSLSSLPKIFITGGGAKNSYLIQALKRKVKGDVIIPSLELIDFKEAIIFAFLGFLRVEGKANSLSTVTGARSNAKGGVIAIP